MICPTCGCCAKENMANFKKFYFCEECREEVKEGSFSFSDPDIDLGSLTPEERAEYEEWLDMLHNNQVQDDFNFFFPDDSDQDMFYDDDLDGCD